MMNRRDLGARLARKAALRAAAVEIRRAKYHGSPLYAAALARRLQHDFPAVATPDLMLSAVSRLAAREGVAVVAD